MRDIIYVDLMNRNRVTTFQTESWVYLKEKGAPYHEQIIRLIKGMGC